MADHLPTLKSRVVLASALVSAFVGLLAASGAVVIVREQQQRQSDRRLLEAGQLFFRELGSGDASVLRELADENDELRALGMRLAFFDGARCVAGDPALGAVVGCRSVGEVRACAFESGPRRVVVSALDVKLPAGWWWLAIALASVLSAAAGAGASYFVAGWALESLLMLERRVTSASGSGALELGARASTAEVEALRAALEALVTQLAEALERSRVFASSAAHELRTPLSTMSAELELLAAAAPAAEREAATRVLRTLRRLTLLVDRLLTLARGEMGPPRPFETIALEDIVRETVAARDEFERARVAIKVEDAGMIHGDESLLGAIVDNLVENSLKFSGGEVGVCVSATSTQVTLSVSDGGPGIPPDALPALLKPFARGDTTVGGHGLGLAIITRAVELHRGALAVAGSTIQVTFPRWRAPPSA